MCIYISEMWSNVTVIAGDMRSIRPIEEADILVSELVYTYIYVYVYIHK
jgi:hypothetical protein